jgi:hypothetical protein
MHPSSTFHPPFIIKKLILSKRGGQREDERRIFSISHKCEAALCCPFVFSLKRCHFRLTTSIRSASRIHKPMGCLLGFRLSVILGNFSVDE